MGKILGVVGGGRDHVERHDLGLVGLPVVVAFGQSGEEVSGENPAGALPGSVVFGDDGAEELPDGFGVGVEMSSEVLRRDDLGLGGGVGVGVASSHGVPFRRAGGVSPSLIIRLYHPVNGKSTAGLLICWAMISGA